MGCRHITAPSPAEGSKRRLAAVRTVSSWLYNKIFDCLFIWIPHLGEKLTGNKPADVLDFGRLFCSHFKFYINYFNIKFVFFAMAYVSSVDVGVLFLIAVTASLANGE